MPNDRVSTEGGQLQFAFGIGVHPHIIQQVFDLIRQITHADAFKGLTVAARRLSDEERARHLALVQIRSHTIAFRNPGSPSQLRRLYTELTSLIDDECEAEIGLRPTALIEFLWNVIDLIEKRFNDDSQRIGRVFAAATIEDAVKIYYGEFPGLTGDPATFVALCSAQNATLEEAKLLLLAHRAISFRAYFTLTWDELLSCYPETVTVDQLRTAMEIWSLEFGGLAGRDPEHFYLDNPIWTQPFIKLDDETFFCPVPGLLWSFSLQIVEELIATKTTLKREYEQRRDKFLEVQVESLFRRSFPTAQIFAGSNWEDPVQGRNGENDLLVILGDVALVVEDKAGAVPDKALRGHPERLKSALGELVVKPSEQARNFIELLQCNPGPHTFLTDSGPANRVDCSGVRRYVPISITWETFGILGLRWGLLQQAGLIPATAEPTVTMSLPELEAVLDMLDSEQRRLHYFTWRSDLEGCDLVAGDEVDILAYYLMTEDKHEALKCDEDELLQLTMASKHVDVEFEKPTYERRTDWPGTRLTQLWQVLLADLSNRRPPRWSEASLHLLNVPYRIQRQFERLVERTTSHVRKKVAGQVQRQAHRAIPALRMGLTVAAFKGHALEECLEVSRAATNLDSVPVEIAVCIRVEDRGFARIGI